MKQLLLRISLPEGRSALRAATFRELLAKEGNGSPLLPPAFFHYGENGRPLSAGEPDIRIVGGQKWVGILSRSGDNPLFDMAVGLASRVVSNYCAAPVRINIEQPEYGFATTDRLFRYFLRDVAIKRRSVRRRKLTDQELIKECLITGLKKEATRMGLDLPGDGALGLLIHDLRVIGMRLGTTKGETKEFVTLANASISLGLNLSGVWQIGNLQARGYGRIVRALDDPLPGSQGFKKVGILS